MAAEVSVIVSLRLADVLPGLNDGLLSRSESTVLRRVDGGLRSLREGHCAAYGEQHNERERKAFHDDSFRDSEND
jgi:hypothetical protein